MHPKLFYRYYIWYKVFFVLLNYFAIKYPSNSKIRIICYYIHYNENLTVLLHIYMITCV